ncbi:MAG: hypothetical protein RLZZ65_1598 [Bacteroidota bacterium]|jgi:uncharacterized protein YbcC (UPF0753/DUF2309 family)
MTENEIIAHSLHVLHHHLPSQAPLKDFIHHNTLHAFQHLPFHQGLAAAQELFGYQTYPSLAFYREQYKDGKISQAILDRVLQTAQHESLKNALIEKEYDENLHPKVGSLRSTWKQKLGFDLDTRVHPILFRLISSFLDQGISIWKFPHEKLSFLESIRALENESFGSLFKSKRAKALFQDPNTTLPVLLKTLTGSSDYFESYLLDQQFAHAGYSGMVYQIESRPQALTEARKISLHDLIFVECLLEIEALDQHFSKNWKTAADFNLTAYHFNPDEIGQSELLLVKSLWQEAYEWTYYDKVLSGIIHKHATAEPKAEAQGIFCIDDRECSIRRHIEGLHPSFSSFGTPGHFNIETYFQPDGSAQRTKICPAPVQPTHLILEKASEKEKLKELHFSARSHGLIFGWILTHTYGFWSALKLALAIFKPSMNKMAVSSSQHMHPDASLSLVYEGQQTADGLQIGFSIEEMVQIVSSLLNSIGLTDQFAELVYIVAHGSSSANNTHYAGYDCGACSGRPGSVNARAFAFMANHPEVRARLLVQNIAIPSTTHFVPVLHDTCRDEFNYFDLEAVPQVLAAKLQRDQAVFVESLDANAVERSRRFVTLSPSNQRSEQHEKVKLRSVSLFEPRPELNHATNSLCLVGRRSFSRNLFLDRRAFLNSYNYQLDPKGDRLQGILNAVAPVCGGINLEYYFSRVDNQQLGAGTKLPHNVMGLFGVANGIDGDLRTGLPSQMIEVHDPYRLLVIVEQLPEVVLETIQRNPATWEWFQNEWVKLVSYDANHGSFFVLRNGKFEAYQVLHQELPVLDDLLSLIANTPENFPVVELKSQAS